MVTVAAEPERRKLAPFDRPEDGGRMASDFGRRPPVESGDRRAIVIGGSYHVSFRLLSLLDVDCSRRLRQPLPSSVPPGSCRPRTRRSSRRSCERSLAESDALTDKEAVPMIVRCRLDRLAAAGAGGAGLSGRGRPWSPSLRDGLGARAGPGRRLGAQHEVRLEAVRLLDRPPRRLGPLGLDFARVTWSTGTFGPERLPRTPSPTCGADRLYIIGARRLPAGSTLTSERQLPQEWRAKLRDSALALELGALRHAGATHHVVVHDGCSATGSPRAPPPRLFS